MRRRTKNKGAKKGPGASGSKSEETRPSTAEGSSEASRATLSVLERMAASSSGSMGPPRSQQKEASASKPTTEQPSGSRTDPNILTSRSQVKKSPKRPASDSRIDPDKSTSRTETKKPLKRSGSEGKNANKKGFVFLPRPSGISRDVIRRDLNQFYGHIGATEPLDRAPRQEVNQPSTSSGRPVDQALQSLDENVELVVIECRPQAPTRTPTPMPQVDEDALVQKVKQLSATSTSTTASKLPRRKGPRNRFNYSPDSIRRMMSTDSSGPSSRGASSARVNFRGVPQRRRCRGTCSRSRAMAVMKLDEVAQATLARRRLSRGRDFTVEKDSNPPDSSHPDRRGSSESLKRPAEGDHEQRPPPGSATSSGESRAATVGSGSTSRYLETPTSAWQYLGFHPPTSPPSTDDEAPEGGEHETPRVRMWPRCDREKQPPTQLSVDPEQPSGSNTIPYLSSAPSPAFWRDILSNLDPPPLPPRNKPDTGTAVGAEKAAVKDRTKTTPDLPQPSAASPSKEKSQKPAGSDAVPTSLHTPSPDLWRDVQWSYDSERIYAEPYPTPPSSLQPSAPERRSTLTSDASWYTAMSQILSEPLRPRPPSSPSLFNSPFWDSLSLETITFYQFCYSNFIGMFSRKALARSLQSFFENLSHFLINNIRDPYLAPQRYICITGLNIWMLVRYPCGDFWFYCGRLCGITRTESWSEDSDCSSYSEYSESAGTTEPMQSAEPMSPDRSKWFGLRRPKFFKRKNATTSSPRRTRWSPRKSSRTSIRKKYRSESRPRAVDSSESSLASDSMSALHELVYFLGRNVPIEMVNHPRPPPKARGFRQTHNIILNFKDLSKAGREEETTTGKGIAKDEAGATVESSFQIDADDERMEDDGDDVDDEESVQGKKKSRKNH